MFCTTETALRGRHRIALDRGRHVRVFPWLGGGPKSKDACAEQRIAGGRLRSAPLCSVPGQDLGSGEFLHGRLSTAWPRPQLCVCLCRLVFLSSKASPWAAGFMASWLSTMTALGICEATDLSDFSEGCGVPL